MSEAIIVALITGSLALVGTIIGTWATNRKSTELILYRLGELEKKQEKHNSVIERTFQLEKDVRVLEQKVKDFHESA